MFNIARLYRYVYRLIPVVVEKLHNAGLAHNNLS